MGGQDDEQAAVLLEPIGRDKESEQLPKPAVASTDGAEGKGLGRTFFVWTAVNTLATIGIVSLLVLRLL